MDSELVSVQSFSVVFVCIGRVRFERTLGFLYFPKALALSGRFHSTEGHFFFAFKDPTYTEQALVFLFVLASVWPLSLKRLPAYDSLINCTVIWDSGSDMHMR